MSTPIETNTEELRGILNDVDNLPNRSTGGSSEPDLVLSIQLPHGKYLNNDYWDFVEIAVKSGSVAEVYAKLQNREEVKVIAEHDYYYNDNHYVGVFYPHNLTAARWESDGDSQRIAMEFWVHVAPGSASIPECISLCIYMDGSVEANIYSL